MILPHILKKAIKKANKSHCRFKISAIGFNKRGEVIGMAVNKHRFVRKGGGLHAERELMLKSSKGLKVILICRVGHSGDLLPIDPCPTCQEVADKLGIKIITVKGKIDE